MANITISGLTGKTAVATDEIEVQATGGGASNKVTLASAFAANNGATLAANTFTALQTITQASANAGILASTGYSLTGSDATGMVNLAGTLNTSGNPIAVNVALTNTASGATTKFLSFKAGAGGATEVFRVDLAGNAYSATGFFLAANNTRGMGLLSSVPALIDGNGSYVLGKVSAGWNIRSDYSFGWSSSADASGTQDASFTRSAAATIQQGAANAASPVAQTLQAQGSRSGTDSNVGGANYTIRAGTGTGTGTLSSLILQSPVAVASGSGAQTDTTGLTIKGGQAVLTAYTVATLPTGITGGRAYVTDATAPTYLGALTGGGAVVCPVFYNGSAWVSG